MKLPINKILCGDWIKVLKTLPDNIFHCCITSPPYWGQRNYGVDGQLGLEKTPEEHIEKLVEGFREIRRVLRPDGVLWLNYGDKYAGSGCGGDYGNSPKQKTNPGSFGATPTSKYKDLEQGNLLMLPARVALALQADGWILRSDVIWAKALSFCDEYSGSTMPESVNGWRWERHRVKVGHAGNYGKDHSRTGKQKHRTNTGLAKNAEYKDCPGCEKCEKNGGLVLRKGSWRCTKGHEYIFQLVKSGNYFCDMEAVREDSMTQNLPGTNYTNTKTTHGAGGGNTGFANAFEKMKNGELSGRNLRDVWVINPQAYPDAHYATFPESLVEPCIKVSTSQKGVCPKCGAQWSRIVKKTEVPFKDSRTSGKHTKVGNGKIRGGDLQIWLNEHPNQTLGWKATCDCGIEETEPALVLDPFMGSGTVGMVSAKLGRNYMGIEINPDYIENQAKYRIAEGETGIPKQELIAGQKALFE